MRRMQGIRALNQNSINEGIDDSTLQENTFTIQSILVVDPDPEFSSTVSDYLKLFGYNISHRSDIDDALQFVKAKNCDVIFLADNFDFHHPIDVLRKFKNVAPSSLIAILANKGDDQLAVELLKSGADDYLSRRIKDKDILTSIANLLEKFSENTPNRINEVKPEELGQIIEPASNEDSTADLVIEKLHSERHLDTHVLNEMLEYLPGALVLLDENLDIKYMNKSCQNLLAYSPEELTEQPVDNILSKNTYSELVKELKLYSSQLNNNATNAVLSARTSKPFEIAVESKLGQPILVRCQISLFKSSNPESAKGHFDSAPQYLLSFEDLRIEQEKHAELLYTSMWNTLLRAFAHRFINLKLENFSDELSSIVSETANFFKLDRFSIYLFDKSNSKARIYLEWLRKDTESLKVFSKKIEIEPNLAEFEKILNNQTQIIKPLSNIEDSSLDECYGLSEHYAQVNAISTAVLPIQQGNKVAGWLALDFQKDKNIWTEDNLEVLEPFGQLFSEAFTRRAREEHRKVTHQKLSENHGRLSEQAFLDGLTNLANRRYFDKVLESEVRRASRDESNIALLFCDVDYFKSYNDTYGHMEGDACLKAISAILKQEFQRAGDFVARFGGEEFAVILSGTLANDALESAEKLRQHIESMNIEHRGSPLGKIAMSIGISSVIAPEANDSKKLLSKADKALYKAKSNGRNRVEVSPFSPR